MRDEYGSSVDDEIGQDTARKWPKNAQENPVHKNRIVENPTISKYRVIRQACLPHFFQYCSFLMYLFENYIFKS